MFNVSWTLTWRSCKCVARLSAKIVRDNTFFRCFVSIKSRISSRFLAFEIRQESIAGSITHASNRLMLCNSVSVIFTVSRWAETSESALTQRPIIFSSSSVFCVALDICCKIRERIPAAMPKHGVELAASAMIYRCMHLLAKTSYRRQLFTLRRSLRMTSTSRPSSLNLFQSRDVETLDLAVCLFATWIRDMVVGCRCGSEVDCIYVQHICRTYLKGCASLPRS